MNLPSVEIIKDGARPAFVAVVTSVVVSFPSEATWSVHDMSGACISTGKASGWGCAADAMARARRAARRRIKKELGNG